MESCNCKCEGDASLEGYTRQLILKYRECYDESCSSIDALRAVLAHLESPLKQIESEIKRCVIESGESISGHGIDVTYRKGYTRHKWDNKGLQGYAVANQDVLAFHSETEVGPSAAIKVR
jgi:hypothetical protein